MALGTEAWQMLDYGGGRTHEVGLSAPAPASHHGYLPLVTNNNECKDNPGSSRVGGRSPGNHRLLQMERLPRNLGAVFTTVVMAKVGCSRQL